MTKKIYLDYAAATPLDKTVMAAMLPYFDRYFYNPSATYLSGRTQKQALESAREQLAKLIGARPAEIIFTSGATEANNLAIQGVMRNFPDGELLVSAVEHESVIAPAQLFNCRKILVNRQGIVNPAEIAKLITPKTVLISLIMVNNELGSVQPVAQVAKLVAEINKQRLATDNNTPLYLHSDAAQAGGFLDLHHSRHGVDLMTINSGKLYGPKQSGLLFIKPALKLQPLLLGGGQEFGLRSGTESVAAAVGLAEALSLAQKNRQKNSQELAKLRNYFTQQITARLPKAQINGSVKNQAPHILNVTFAGADNERLMMQLDEAGYQVAVGSACSASSDQPSHVLTAIGLSPKQAQSTLRFSFGRQTKEQDLEGLIKQLVALLASQPV